VQQLLSQHGDLNVQGKLSIEFHALTKIMMQVAELQHNDIRDGKLSMGFGDFYGTNRTLKYFTVNCYFNPKGISKSIFSFYYAN
jgi:hypothetical protein